MGTGMYCYNLTVPTKILIYVFFSKIEENIFKNFELFTELEKNLGTYLSKKMWNL